MPEPPKVFISYSNDSPEHAARVLALADALRHDGVDATLDRYNPVPSEGWPRWMEQKMDDANFVLMICTETYHRRVLGKEEPGVGRGVLWEANLIYNRVYNNTLQGHKYVPILLDGAAKSNIPMVVSGYTYYQFTQFQTEDDQYQALYRHLTNQPETPAPPLGPIQQLELLPRLEQKNTLMPLQAETVLYWPSIKKKETAQEFLPLACDRRDQVNDFRVHFAARYKRVGMPPAMYVICGDNKDQHNSFVKRLAQHDLDSWIQTAWKSQKNDRTAPYSTSAHGLVKPYSCTWNKYVEPGDRTKVLERDIYLDCGLSLAADANVHKLHQRFVNLDAKMVVFEFTIRNWDAKSHEFVDWCLNYWNGLKSLELPQIVIFVNIIVPERPALVQRALGTKEFNRPLLRAAITATIAKHSGLTTCQLLPDLSPVERDDLLKWNRSCEIGLSNAILNQRIKEIFKRRELAKMQFVEETLNELCQ